jgi:hypothetical protein
VNPVDRTKQLATEPAACATCGCQPLCVCACICHAPGTGGSGGGRETLPVPTPFLVIPCRPGDAGARPLATSQAIYSEAIGWTVANPDAPGGWHDYQLRVSCAVANLGPVASPAAMIEFYIGTAIAIRHKQHATLTPAEVQAGVKLLGRRSFTAPPGVVTTVTCPLPWVPGAYKAALQGILVQVRDLFTDPWTAPFDAFHDRHVGRNDDTMPRLWNTGVNFNAAPVAPAAMDQHWVFVAGPGITGPRPCVAVAEQHPGGAYFPTVDSAWIWQDAAGTADVGVPYTFRLTINLSGLDPSSVTLGGAWGVDNDGTITVNGQTPTGTGAFSLTNATHDNYNVVHPFSITGGFVAGTNTLDIQVINADGPAALNVTALKLSGTPA